MTDPKEQQRERFAEAVERKNEDARRKSEDDDAQGVEPVGGVHGDQADIDAHGRPQDTRGPRDKSSRKGKVTADKWNQ